MSETTPRTYGPCTVCGAMPVLKAIPKPQPRGEPSTEYAVTCGCEEFALYLTDPRLLTHIPKEWEV